MLINAEDSYLLTPLKSSALYSWGSSTSSYYTVRANDDVYIHWPAVLSTLSTIVPSRVYGENR
jgi:hypothetical protein